MRMNFSRYATTTPCINVTQAVTMSSAPAPSPVRTAMMVSDSSLIATHSATFPHEFVRSCLKTSPNLGSMVLRAALRALPIMSATQASVAGRTDILAIRARLAPKSLVLESKIMADVSGNGHVHVLSWWLDWWGGPKELARFASAEVVINAAFFGHVAVLEWWRHTGLVKHAGWWKWAVIEASRRGSVDVLRWWASTPELSNVEYSEAPIDFASGNGHVDVLQWWLRESGGKTIKYSEHAMRAASIEGHVHVLRWWLGSGLELKYSEDAMDLASGYGRVDVLDWWLASQLELKYSSSAMDSASRNGCADVLEWWARNAMLHPTRIRVLYSPSAFVGQYYEDPTHPVRKWWDKNLASLPDPSSSPVILRRAAIQSRQS
ncbi:hypothetical protein BCR44DRAFT_1440418 [Catenaria anguillulae PL171]|uniref:Ankyrin repeat-containing domain protein n=1 Tax=Catenaria anguillulae PL171 TaxID=765915 RepID=A0A1Y2HD16_9FUNG|nr:hypothetical protein BCR44DRAFT_1440418 [Catenaria anguillulae PL171]